MKRTLFLVFAAAVACMFSWSPSLAQCTLPWPATDPSVPDFAMVCPSPIPGNLGGLGIGVDDNGDMYRCLWDNSFHPIPEIVKGPPCGPWTNFLCQDINGAPVTITALAWDCDHDTLWGAHVGGSANVYTIEFQGNIAICHLQFSLAGAAAASDLAWDHSDQSLWWLSSPGAFASRVYHITSPLTRTGSYNPGGYISIFDASQTAIQVQGIAATPTGLWVTTYGSVDITLHSKNGATPGQFTGTSFPTFCTDNRDLETDPVNQPGTCLLWCVDQHYDAHVAYSTPLGDCCPPPVAPGENCDNPIEITLELDDFPFTFSGSTAGMTSDVPFVLPACTTGTGPDVILRFFLPLISDSLDLMLSAASDFVSYVEILKVGDPCEAPSREEKDGFVFKLLPPITTTLTPLPEEPDPPMRPLPLGIVVRGSGTQDAGSFSLTLELEHADPLSLIGSVPYQIADSTVGLHDNHHGDCNTSPDAKYSFVAPTTGEYVISLCGTEFDAMLDVTTGGDYPGDSLLVRHDDGGCIPWPDTSGLSEQPWVTVSLVGGQQYYIIVDGKGDNVAGNYTLFIDHLYPFPVDCPYPELDDPFNDIPCEALTIGCPDTICAGIFPAGDSDWFRVWVPPLPECRNFTIDVFAQSTPYLYPWGQGLNSVVEFYDGCFNQILLGSDDDGGTGTDSRLLTACLDGSTAGQYYYIRVGAQQHFNTGPYILATTCDACVCDTCLYPECDAYAEPINNNCNQDFCVMECGDTLCGNVSTAGDEDWYWVFVPQSPSGCMRLTVDIFGDDTPTYYPYQRGLDPKLEIFRGPCTTRFINHSSGGSGNDPSANPCLAPGTYAVRVTGENGTSGPYIISTACDPCVCGTCPTPVFINSLPFTFTGAITDFDADLDGCGDTGGPDGVFLFTPDTDMRAMISTCGSYVNTVLELRADDECPGEVQIQCNDNDGPACQGSQSSIFAELDSGRTYYVILDCPVGSTGDFTLSVTDVGPCVITYQPGDMTELPEAQDSTHTLNDPNGGCDSGYPSFYGAWTRNRMTMWNWDATGIAFSYPSGYGDTLLDTDWWYLPAYSTGTVAWTVTADFPIQIEIVDVADCSNPQIVGAHHQDSICVPTTVVANVIQGGRYAAYIRGTQVGLPSCSYRGEVEYLTPVAPVGVPEQLTIQVVESDMCGKGMELTWSPGEGTLPVAYVLRSARELDGDWHFIEGCGLLAPCGRGRPKLPPWITPTFPEIEIFTVAALDSFDGPDAEVVWNPFVPYQEVVVPYVEGGSTISFGGAWLSSTGPTDGCWLFPPDSLSASPLPSGCWYPHPVARVPGSVYHVREFVKAAEVTETDTVTMTFMWQDSVGNDAWDTEVELIFEGPIGDSLRVHGPLEAR